MDIKRLRNFIIIVKEGSLHRAAAKLNIAQPALSRQVRDLEEELDACLFVRSAQGMRLSPAGEVFLSEVRLLLPQVERASERTRRAQLGKFGLLRVAYTSVAADSRFAVAAFAQAKRSMPEIEMSLQMLSSEDQLDAFKANEIDLGILYHRGVVSPEFEYHGIRVDNYVLAVSSNHAMAGREKVNLIDFRGEDFIFSSPNSQPLVYAEWMNAFHLAGYAPNTIFGTQSEAMVLNFVAEGLAIGFVNSSLNERRPFPGVSYLQVEELDVPLHLAAVWRRDRETPSISTFIELLSNCVQGDDEPATGSSALC